MGWVLPISPGKTKENFFWEHTFLKTLIKSVYTYSLDRQWRLELIHTFLLSRSIPFWVDPYPFEKKGVDQLKTLLKFHTVCFCFKIELFQKVLSLYLTFYSDLIMGLFEIWLSGEILFFFWLRDTTMFITWGLKRFNWDVSTQNYHSHAIITSGSYIFKPLFEDHFFVFKVIFPQKITSWCRNSIQKWFVIKIIMEGTLSAFWSAPWNVL